MIADIIKAHIIGQNDDNIRRSLPLAPPFASILPIYRAVRSDRICRFLSKADKGNNQRGAIDIGQRQSAGEEHQRGQKNFHLPS